MKHLRQVSSVLLVILTLAIFIYYWRTHPGLFSHVNRINPMVVLALIFLYVCLTAVLVVIYILTLRLCKLTIPVKEQILLTIYSSLINFFGPLQSGPGVRALYLKKRHNLSLRSYALASSVYYLIFAIISGSFLLCGFLSIHQVGIFFLTLLLIGWFAMSYIKSQLEIRLKNLPSFRLVAGLVLATLIQICLVTLIYWIELRVVGIDVGFRHVAAYTGAANFALFVSLTPGALGFRESFQIFSKGIHHVGAGSIIAANIIDRSIYVIFLGLLFILASVFHIKDKLAIRHPEDIAQAAD